ncbi:hypothetical protein PVAG01_03245 [Phlyctema vagabunda]|uniref:Uncharacterized protein n=1 Tax=Phlyctema vagabunda TaxID=108571 RepID=A0ABR4PSX1_9HELO
MPNTRFFGSQVGGRKITPLSYTGSPLQLLRHDVFSAFSYYKSLPFIIWPIQPFGSGDLCELYPSRGNLYDIFLHLVLLALQLPFLISVPFWIFLPFPPLTFVLGIVGFWLVNRVVYQLINGPEMKYQSDPKFAAARPEHAHEQWVLLNGVAVGRHWLTSNVNRLALTFGRPVLGVHNKTNGILFDVIQCLIQRNFNYATQDVRDCYSTVKELLYEEHLTKVVFILHSQGGIEGGMIIDWLLQEVPQDLLAKLEVYTFGNAANHFNNPHSHLISQNASFLNPNLSSITQTRTQVHYHAPLANGQNPDQHSRSHKSKSAGKAIRYIEHYAQTDDFVAKWGVLHFTSDLHLTDMGSRFMGRVFERQGKGHQLNQHYLDNMFPLKKTEDGKGGIGGTGFLGAEEENNEFMNSSMELAIGGDKGDEREGMEMSYSGTHGEPLNRGEVDVLLRDMSPVSPASTRAAMKEFVNGKGLTNGTVGEKNDFRVKDLSRLWLYRNGQRPKFDEVDIGISRMATI